MMIRGVIDQYLAWAQTYYKRPSGKQTGEAVNMKHALGPVVQLHAERHLNELVAEHVVAVQRAMIGQGLARNTANSRMGRCRRFVRWAIERGHARSAAILPWDAVAGLKYGRSEARETPPVVSAPLRDVRATLAELDEQMRRMVRLQMATGMRSSELCSIRWDLIDRTRHIWVYTPVEHKTEHWGHRRYIAIRPPEQINLVKPQRGVYIFMTRSGRPYTRDTYRQNIKRAIRRAGCGEWTPHQLRHSAITRWANELGVDAARLLAGHASPVMTMRYIDHSAEQVLKAADRLQKE